MIGLIGATLTIFATTIDDVIWLVPYVASGSPWIRLIHMTTFVGTLVALAVMCVLLSTGLLQIMPIDESWILGAIGASLCWAIAIGLFVKKWLKKRRRALALQQEIVQPDESGHGYGAVASHEEEHATEVISRHAAPWVVMSFTCLGALDEISYFPALLVGHVFTGWELIVGALLASCIMLLVITTFLPTCQPIISWLDRIPLYAIVCMFAIILTVSAFMDKWSDGLLNLR